MVPKLLRYFKALISRPFLLGAGVLGLAVVGVWGTQLFRTTSLDPDLLENIFFVPETEFPDPFQDSLGDLRFPQDQGIMPPLRSHRFRDRKEKRSRGRYRFSGSSRYWNSPDNFFLSDRWNRNLSPAYDFPTDIDELPKPSTPSLLGGFAMNAPSSGQVSPAGSGRGSRGAAGDSKETATPESKEGVTGDKSDPAQGDPSEPASDETKTARAGRFTSCDTPEWLGDDSLPNALDSLFELSCDALDGLGVVNVSCPAVSGKGASGKDDIDDTEALARIFGSHDNDKKLIIVPPGTYLISEALNLTAKRVLGAPSSKGQSIIKIADSVTKPLERMAYALGGKANPENFPFDIQNLTFDANDRALTAFYFSGNNGVYSTIKNVSFLRAKGVGVYCDSSSESVLERVKSEGNGGDGFLLENCSGEALVDIIAQNNRGYGVHMNRKSVGSSVGASSMSVGPLMGTSMSGGNYLQSGKIINNRGGGIFIDGPNSRTVVRDSCVKTANNGIQIAGETRYCNIIGNEIEKLGSDNPDARMIQIDEGVSGCLVQDNAVKGQAQFAEIKLNGSNNVVIGNIIAEETEIPVLVAYSNRNMVISLPLRLRQFIEQPLQSGSGKGLKRSIVFMEALPEAGGWLSGDVILNGSAVSPFGWVCSGKIEGQCNWTPLSQVSAVLKSGGGLKK